MSAFSTIERTVSEEEIGNRGVILRRANIIEFAGLACLGVMHGKHPDVVARRTEAESAINTPALGCKTVLRRAFHTHSPPKSTEGERRSRISIASTPRSCKDNYQGWDDWFRFMSQRPYCLGVSIAGDIPGSPPEGEADS